VIDSVMVGTNDLDRAACFYDAVLGVIGAKRLID
jgi:catechol 2,3-dioxygenase-like lactoylglutathione lyase family enzyme